MKTPWSRLIRFQDDAGTTYYGNQAEGQDATEAEILQGDSPFNLTATGKKKTIAHLLAPLQVQDVPLVRCIGLNYKTHILETGHPLPENPTVFIKPAPSVAGPGAIAIPKLAQAMLDYEGELTIVIGKAGKDIAVDEALEYVAGYTVGNDVSARDWQTQPAKAGPRPQWCYGKSFDEFAPLGPCIVSADVLGDCASLQLTTTVNGKQRQHGSISDLVFGVKELVAFCSQGQTLQQGTLIMTGTPGGVGLFMDPKTFLQDGDVVEVAISQIGTLSNTMRFE